MRGKVYRQERQSICLRITPAYVGKSDSGGGRYQQRQDHPRLCGEKMIVIITVFGRRGSPPPMRGKVQVNRHCCRCTGITPAYAGKSDQCRQCRQQTGDHPRLCGEKTAFHSLKPLFWGSPPPMRGKAHVKADGVKFARITPAYAGKSTLRNTQSTYVLGSPPPMRGKA